MSSLKLMQNVHKKVVSGQGNRLYVFTRGKSGHRTSNMPFEETRMGSSKPACSKLLTDRVTENNRPFLSKRVRVKMCGKSAQCSVAMQDTDKPHMVQGKAV
jgi:hypothetical protein